MSKTVSTQIEKVGALVQGIRGNHTDELKSAGLSEALLAEMEACCAELRRQDEELDALRQDVHRRVQECGDALDRLKQKFQQARMIVRNHYPQEKWPDFGLFDKR